MKVEEFSNLTEALNGLKDKGYTANFVFEGSALHESPSGKMFSSLDLSIVDVYRFEGASDPDDMAVLYVLECKDGSKGTLVDAFGTYGNQKLSDFVNAIQDVRNDEKREPNLSR